MCGIGYILTSIHVVCVSISELPKRVLYFKKSYLIVYLTKINNNIKLPSVISM